jgi:SAM-dependent methyltransferase
MTDVEHKARVQQQFGASAEGYVTSAGHASGDDLEQLALWAEAGPDRLALDVATGAGHTALALAPRVGRVVASDLTERMLETAETFIRSKGVANVEFRRADAEDLPFADASFDLVSCRIAPHHFADAQRFVCEVARVLRPGGLFLLEDSIVPDDPALDEFMNHAEKLRDATHVRSLRASEWRDLLISAGFAIEGELVFAKPHPLQDWLDRAHTPAAERAAVLEMFQAASPAARAAFGIAFDADGKVESYTDEKIAIKARKGRKSS